MKASINDIELLIRTVRGVACGETILDRYFTEGIQDAAFEGMVMEQEEPEDQ